MRRLLIIGCGDVGLRLLPSLSGHFRVFALQRDPARAEVLRSRGATPILGNLDDPRTLRRLSGLADDVVHLAPPPDRGARDTRTTHLIQALSRSTRLPQRLVYVSTSGVYGDCGGQMVNEVRPARPQTDRARRRVHAEGQLRAWGKAHGVRISVLRVPGIYAADRLPLQRLAAGTPALVREEDSYSNHVHADDLARMILAALRHGRAGRCYNASDDSDLRMGDYFDLVAERFGLPPPPRIARHEARERIPAPLLSFLNESRRLDNGRLKRELGFTFRYPTVSDGLDAMGATSAKAVPRPHR